MSVYGYDFTFTVGTENHGIFEMLKDGEVLLAHDFNMDITESHLDDHEVQAWLAFAGQLRRRFDRPDTHELSISYKDVVEVKGSSIYGDTIEYTIYATDMDQLDDINAKLVDLIQKQTTGEYKEDITDGEVKLATVEWRKVSIMMSNDFFELFR